MPRRNRTGSTLATSAPSTPTVPDDGSAIRLIIRMDVVLPQPDGPTNTVSVPGGTSRFSRATATVPSSYTLWTSWKTITDQLPIGWSKLLSSSHFRAAWSGSTPSLPATDALRWVISALVSLADTAS